VNLSGITATESKAQVEVEIRLAELPEKPGKSESQMKYWVMGQKKTRPDGVLWYHTGKVLAYVFGARKDEVFLQQSATGALQESLALLMDGGAYGSATI